MMEIREIAAERSSEYLDKLNYLVDSVIDLPVEAKNAYKNQWTAERIASQRGNWLFLTAEEKNHTISGLILGTPIEGGVGTIVWVLVDRSIQKKGIGSDLLATAKAWYKARGAHKIKLTVPDRKTVDFYLKQGMILEGEHKNHWWGHDFWSMGMIINK